MPLPISKTRRAVAGFLLGFGVCFAGLALAVFSLPFLAALAHTYEGGEQVITTMLFYFLLAIPACLFTATAIWVRGWREARAGYITLACLFGLPILFVLAMLILAGISSL